MEWKMESRLGVALLKIEISQVCLSLSSRDNNIGGWSIYLRIEHPLCVSDIVNCNKLLYITLASSEFES
jgi:hypothetical protein